MSFNAIACNNPIVSPSPSIYISLPEPRELLSKQMGRRVEEYLHCHSRAGGNSLPGFHLVTSHAQRLWTLKREKQRCRIGGNQKAAPLLMQIILN
jgi:hypothetical protein